MLEIKNIYKTFNAGTVNEKRALKGVNLTLEDGDFVTVIGGNGAGKSTLLNAIAGVWPVDEGEIIIDGKNVTKLPEHKRAAYLGRVFQDPMNGTAATMGTETWSDKNASRRYQRKRAGSIQEAAGNSWSWTGRQTDFQSRSALWWTKTGADSSDGNVEEAKAVASG